MRITLITALVAMCALVGCSTMPVALPYEMVNKFDESEVTPYASTGTASITGQAFAKTRGGDVKYGAGNKVLLTPKTKFTAEITAAIESGKMPNGDPRMSKYVRETTADGSGNFEFKNLPTGEYYVECGVFWDYVYVDYGGATPRQTGSMMRKLVKIGEGETVKIILSN